MPNLPGRAPDISGAVHLDAESCDTVPSIMHGALCEYLFRPGVGVTTSLPPSSSCKSITSGHAD